MIRRASGADIGTQQEAWDAFWQNDARTREQRPTGAKGGGGCLPQAWQGIDKVQRAIWGRFAEKLPRGARVLDAATGDGRVMEALLAKRRDLKPVGVDLAKVLPAAPRGTKLRGGVAMEDLPFGEASFAAITSQFGFEYSDIASSAAEFARVLKRGGSVGLICHRPDGPIVAHNAKRRDAILWALEEKDLISAARKAALMRPAQGLAGGMPMVGAPVLGSGLGRAAPAALPQEIAAAPAQGAALFGQHSAAWEMAEAIRQTLILGQRAPAAQVVQALDDIAAQARNELGRIASLEAAASTAGDGAPVIAAMRDAGFEETHSELLAEGTGKSPFATFLGFRLPA